MLTSTPATAPFIPMAVSLAWGVLFATFITLILVPCLYVVVEDWLGFLANCQRWLAGGKFNDTDANLIVSD